MKEVRLITNVVVLETFRQRKQAVNTYYSGIVATEAAVPAELRDQYALLRHEYADMLDHAIVDACLELDLDVAMSRDLANRLNGCDVPACSLQSIAELSGRYDPELLRVASLAVDFEGFMKFQLIPTESGYGAKWCHLQGA